MDRCSKGRYIRCPDRSPNKLCVSKLSIWTKSLYIRMSFGTTFDGWTDALPIKAIEKTTKISNQGSGHGHGYYEALLGRVNLCRPWKIYHDLKLPPLFRCLLFPTNRYSRIGLDRRRHCQRVNLTMLRPAFTSFPSPSCSFFLLCFLVVVIVVGSVQYHVKAKHKKHWLMPSKLFEGF